MDNIEIFDRIPTATHPLEKHYMLPFTQFLHQWVNDELFYVDFVDFCPFNRELASHFYVQRFISPMHKNWASKSFALFCADRLFKSCFIEGFLVFASFVSKAHN